MTRKATIIRCSEDGKRCIAVDNELHLQLFELLNKDKRYKKKLQHIFQIILEGLINRELYDKEEPDSKSKGVRAMKLFKGQENDRIYCREITMEDKTFIVIAAEILYRKKQTDLTNRELNVIHRVAKYEYSEIRKR